MLNTGTCQTEEHAHFHRILSYSSSSLHAPYDRLCLQRGKNTRLTSKNMEVTRMKKVLVVLGSMVCAAVVLGALGMFVVSTALAQTPTPLADAAMMVWNGADASGCGGGCGDAGSGGCMISGTNTIHNAVAKTLGLTTEQLYAERAAGKTLAQIAKDKGVSEQQLTDVILAELKQFTDQAVKSGRITQAQADWVQAQAKARVPLMLNSPFGPGEAQGHGGYGRGRGFGRGFGGAFGHTEPWVTPLSN
jgi:hypothetical protein